MNKKVLIKKISPALLVLAIMTTKYITINKNNNYNNQKPINPNEFNDLIDTHEKKLNHILNQIQTGTDDNHKYILLESNEKDNIIEATYKCSECDTLLKYTFDFNCNHEFEIDENNNWSCIKCKSNIIKENITRTK